MKIKTTFLFILFAVIFSMQAYAWKPEDAALFKKANENYRKGDFKEASAIYEELSGKYPAAADFYYNLGNSLYRLGRRGDSILAYERARLRDPRNQDILHNLKYVSGQLEYRIDDKRNWYLKAAQDALDYFTEKEVISWVLMTYLLLMASWAFVLFFRADATWGWKRKTLVVFSVIFLLLGIAKNVKTYFIRDAIVTSKEAQVRYGPSDSDQVGFRLKEGLKVYVVDQRDEWSRILLVNGESGWARNSQISEVK